MYISFYGNAIFDCIVVSSPKYMDSVGEYKSELTKCMAKTKEQTPEGMQSVNVNLLFFNAFAIPAMKISSGMCLVVIGREQSNERMEKGRKVLERSVYVDWWAARDIDPLGHLEELKVRREMTTREIEFKNIFWEWLNTESVKELIIGWFVEWLRKQREQKDDQTAKPDNKRISDNSQKEG